MMILNTRSLRMMILKMGSLKMKIPDTSCTSKLACTQEHISDWPLSCTVVWRRRSTAGVGWCGTAGTPAASAHGGTSVQGQHCTAVLAHSDTAASAQCCTLALALPGIVVKELASEQAGTPVVEFQNIFVPQPFVV